MQVLPCFNDDYDLSDIDTTAGVTVTDLVVPVNLDDITLEAMLDLDDDSRVKSVNGEYAIVQDGTFASKPVSVSRFTAQPVDVEPIVDNIDVDMLLAELQQSAVAVEPETQVLQIEISRKRGTVTVEADDVDASIVSIEHVAVEPVQLDITMTFAGLSDAANELTLKSLKYQFIKALDATIDYGTYDAETGVITLPETTTSGHRLDLVLTVTGIGSGSGMTVYADHSAELKQDCGVIEGYISVAAGDIKSAFYNVDGTLDVASLADAVPDAATFTCVTTINAITATHFTGQIEYAIEDLDIEDVALTGIPDVLNQSGTSISLANPQFYLQISNPVSTYDLYAQTGLKITSHSGTTSSDYTLDAPIIIDEADDKYCLSPSQPATYYSGEIENGEDGQTADFAGSTFAAFSSLGEVLAGDKLPETLSVSAVDPKIPLQTVEDFPLGNDIDDVAGLYVFYAPLQLTADAKVKYTDTFDGWNDEDVDAITITKLVVNADISTDIPLSLDIVIYPIDVDGNKMSDGSGGYVKGTSSVTVVYGMDEPVEVTVSGTVTHLDGIILEARATGASDADEPLKPSQVITLKNLKATVSGTYVKEL